MDIKELLQSTYKVSGRYKPNYTFSQKEFGGIYAFNKTVSFKPSVNVIEITMYMGVATETKKSAHKIAIALFDIKTEQINRKQLIELVRKEHNFGNELSDIEILDLILEEEKPILQNKTVIQSGTNLNNFLLVENTIPLTTKIRVKCSCSNFFYVWAWYNADHKALIGLRPPKYKPYVKLDRKQLTTLTPKLNPHKRPGVCKHLLLFLALLMNGGILQDSTDLTSSYTKRVPDLEIIPRGDMSDMLGVLNAELKLEQEKSKLQRSQVAKELKDIASAKAKIKQRRALRKKGKIR